VNTGYEYLLEFFPDYDYRRPFQPERVVFSRPDNITGHQQRALNVWWAIEQCGKTGGVGLELGSGGVHTPWCLSTDAYATSDHPVYGGACRPHMALSAHQRLPFEDGSFSLVLANHVVEHLPGDVPAILRDWVRVLKQGGVLAVVLPDQTYVDVLAIDKDHKQAWTAQQFREQVLVPLGDVVDVLSFDTFKNNFSFDAVMRKR
jgi:methyltransferase family protein